MSEELENNEDTTENEIVEESEDAQKTEDGTQEDTTENELLEMSYHFKELIQEKEDLLNVMKDKYITTKKQIGRCYGLIIELQEYLDDIPIDELFKEDDMIIDFITNAIRTICSNVLFKTEVIELCLED